MSKRPIPQLRRVQDRKRMRLHCRLESRRACPQLCRDATARLSAGLVIVRAVLLTAISACDRNSTSVCRRHFAVSIGILIGCTPCIKRASFVEMARTSPGFGASGVRGFFTIQLETRSLWLMACVCSAHDNGMWGDSGIALEEDTLGLVFLQTTRPMCIYTCICPTMNILLPGFIGEIHKRRRPPLSAHTRK